MCGIAGRRSRQAEPLDHLKRVGTVMNACLRHRGPDMEGHWTDPRGLAHLAFSRLAIQDLSPEANQPMVSDSGRFVMVFNGEVYNCDELRQWLGRSPAQFRTHSDTEVLLACVEKSGLEKTLARTNGMFAIALWDTATGTLSLARDRFGKKPLYYAMDDTGLLFASELKAILRAEPRRRQISTAAAAAYFALLYVPAPLSIFEGIKKVLPGQIAEFSPELVLREQPFWSLEGVLSKREKKTTANGEALVQQIDELLEDAVRRRLISDVPVAVLLSGGIDSSLVAYMVSRRIGAPLKAFSIGVEDEALDESTQAAEIAKRIGIDHEILRISRADALGLADTVFESLDEPFADSSAIPTYAVCRLASKAATVLLTGDGGDEVFGGYPRHQYGVGRGKWTAHAYARWRRKSPRMDQREVAFELYRRLMTTGTHGGSADPDLLPSLVPAVGQLNRMSLLDHLRYLDFKLYLPDDILVKVDRMSMANSVELRAPFLDYRLVELCWSISDAALVGRGVRKRVTRELFARHIGRDLMQTAKHGFAAPISQWLRGPLRQQFDAACDALSQHPGLPWGGPEIARVRCELDKGTRLGADRAWTVYAYWRWHRQWAELPNQVSASVIN